MYVQLAVLEEGDGPSMTSDEPGDGNEDESIDTKEQSPPQPASAAATSRSSLPQTPSTEDLSAKKKPPSRSLRAPTAGKSEFLHIRPPKGRASYSAAVLFYPLPSVWSSLMCLSCWVLSWS